MNEKELLQFAKKFDECLRVEAPAQFEAAKRDQEAILNALRSTKLNLLKKANVVGVGVGYHYRKGRRTEEMGPIVYVSQKLPRAKLKAEDVIPEFVVIDGSGKKRRVDVIETGPVIPTCEFGVPDTQHAEFDPTPPGVAVSALDPTTLAINTRGSGGAIVQPVQGQAMFLLTCDHVVPQGQTLGQPWKSRAIGGHVASAASFDASICEINNPDVNLHCFGPVRGPVPALVGLGVKKSGARTGVTSSVVIANAAFAGIPGTTVVIDNEAQIPPSVGGAFISNYVGPGDSGSMTVVGNPANAADFGPTGNALIDAIVALVPAPSRPLIRQFLTFRLTNAAVSLNFAIRANGPGGVPPRLALGHPIQAVLDDFPGNPLRLA
jgi:hypothetical protein